MTRTTITTNWTARPPIGKDAIAPISTGIWNDSLVWEEANKWWIDTGTTSDTIWI